MAKIDAITVCVDYADYLKYSISNSKLFDSLTVITVDRDKDTINLCKQHNVRYVFSERLYENGPFQKGKAINDGLAQIGLKNFVCHVDSDVVLPPELGEFLKTAPLCASCLYALYGRYNVNTKEDLVRMLKRNTIDKSEVESIYTFSGYFQLWHSKLRPFYPEDSHNAGTDDLTLVEMFPKKNRKILQDFFCLHLGPTFTNHNGRVSPKFE